MEVERIEYDEATQDSFTDGVQEIAFEMSEEERLRLSEVLKSGISAQDNDACWAITKLMEGARNMSESNKEDFLRAMASI